MFAFDPEPSTDLSSVPLNNSLLNTTITTTDKHISKSTTSTTLIAGHSYC